MIKLRKIQSSRKRWLLLVGALLVVAIIIWIVLVIVIFKDDSEPYHDISYNLGELEDLFLKTPTKAKAGEVVDVQIAVIYDGGIHLYLDGQELPLKYNDGEYRAFSFVMPDRDVMITAKPYTKAEIWGDGIHVFPLTPSEEGVADFLEMMEAGDKTDKDWHNVSPNEMTDKYGFRVFKDDDYMTYLVFEGKIYLLGESFGGLGTNAFAVADLNCDGSEELFFAFSWGSGMHRSQIGYFDSASREVTVFDYANFHNDMTFVAEAGVLEVRNATVKQFRSAVDMDVIPQEERVGIITFTDDQFVLEVDQ